MKEHHKLQQERWAEQERKIEDASWDARKETISNAQKQRKENEKTKPSGETLAQI